MEKKLIKPITPEKIKQLGKGSTDKLKKVKGLQENFLFIIVKMLKWCRSAVKQCGIFIWFCFTF